MARRPAPPKPNCLQGFPVQPAPLPRPWSPPAYSAPPQSSPSRWSPPGQPTSSRDLTSHALYRDVPITDRPD